MVKIVQSVCVFTIGIQVHYQLSWNDNENVIDPCGWSSIFFCVYHRVLKDLNSWPLVRETMKNIQLHSSCWIRLNFFYYGASDMAQKKMWSRISCKNIEDFFFKNFSVSSGEKIGSRILVDQIYFMSLGFCSFSFAASIISKPQLLSLINFTIFLNGLEKSWSGQALFWLFCCILWCWGRDDPRNQLIFSCSLFCA